MISTIYHSYGYDLPGQIKTDLKNTIEAGLDAHDQFNVFFRADDIGVPSKNYEQLMALFLKYQTPLCLAVVPAWITRPRWDVMKGFLEKGEGLFCWHMHGYRHYNHEPQGKRQEFGPARSSQALFNDLSKGQARLESIMGKTLTQVFTPPWNRCTSQTMVILKKIGFKGISRSDGSLPLPPQGMKEFAVHVDLHTRKEKQARAGWQNLFEEFRTGMASGTCGIMIHHMRMNPQAFVFLEYVLDLFSRYESIHCLTYTDLI